MDKDAVIEKVRAHTKDNKIACKQALRIAKEENISSKDLGEILNELKIKVAHCQLGCFP
ncbi:hypothetical protein [Syntrophorhabdus aromaticivorans]|uniref:Uncharacterized protein n=1 Tax=Syntrophorhabdus aromaticivorans TaxID=328301 RepID=A0A971M2C0_9BACT|nr:hypothetical protein [Syntrophorhabdus aromaticivorans]NLW34510.1 hypothetical protein [Syntrophorhabdus aromaticivorans]